MGLGVAPMATGGIKFVAWDVDAIALLMAIVVNIAAVASSLFILAMLGVID